jgi:hypothetical protein
MKLAKSYLSAALFLPIIPMIASLASVIPALAQSTAWTTQGHNVQHTGVSSFAVQPLKTIHWKTRVDLHPPTGGGTILIHYGSPLVTLANTVIVPVKVGTDTFRLVAKNGQTGATLWTQGTQYRVPSAGFTPSFGPALYKDSVIIPDDAGTVLVRQHPDQAQGSVTRLVFYGADVYKKNHIALDANIKINTPISVDSAGNIYFGFLVFGQSSAGPQQSGLARIAANGQGSWVAPAAVSNDSAITKVMFNCAPALSKDESKLYVAVNSQDFGFGYLLALDPTTLNLISKVRLTDPASGLDASLADESSAMPMVGPDGDVYFGVLETPFPSHNDRGWLLHFNSDLSQQKIPGSFGWDDTASVVGLSLVPSYHGKSKYLLMTKYNNYAGINTGDGVNKIAILDPNATEADPVIPGTLVMAEVLTIKGLTPDPNNPGGVKEWCINSAAVDPSTKSVLANSEDGKLYRWDLTTNRFTKVIKLTAGIGEAYTPTVIGSDGTAYAINDALLFAVGQ